MSCIYHKCEYVCTCTCVHMFVRVHVCMHMCVYVCVRVCAHSVSPYIYSNTQQAVAKNSAGQSKSDT